MKYISLFLISYFYLTQISGQGQTEFAPSCQDLEYPVGCGIDFSGDFEINKDQRYYLAFIAGGSTLEITYEYDCEDSNISPFERGVAFYLYVVSGSEIDCGSFSLVYTNSGFECDGPGSGLITETINGLYRETIYILEFTNCVTTCSWTGEIINEEEVREEYIFMDNAAYAEKCWSDLTQDGIFCDQSPIRFNFDGNGFLNPDVYYSVRSLDGSGDSNDVIWYDGQNEVIGGSNYNTNNFKWFIDVTFGQAGKYEVCLDYLEASCALTESYCKEVTILESGIRNEYEVSMCIEDLVEGVDPDVEDEFGNLWPHGKIYLEDIEDGYISVDTDDGCFCFFTDVLKVSILYPGEDFCEFQNIETCPQWANGLDVTIDGASVSSSNTHTLNQGTKVVVQVDEDILPDASNIDWYLSSDPDFIPGKSGTLISSSSISSNWQSCNQSAKILSLLMRGNGSSEEELMIIGSGSGFYTDELILDIENNCSTSCPTDCEELEFGDGCDWMTGNENLIEGCSNVIAVGPGDYIPPNSVLVLYINNKSQEVSLTETLCSYEGCIYVMTNACDRCLNAFRNNGSSGSYSIITSCGESYIDYSSNSNGGEDAFVTWEGVNALIDPGVLPPGIVDEFNLKSNVSDFTWTVNCSNLQSGSNYLKGVINSTIYNSDCCSPYTPTLSFNVNCGNTTTTLNWDGATNTFLPNDIRVENVDCATGYTFGNMFNDPTIGATWISPNVNQNYITTCNGTPTFTSSHSPSDIFDEGVTTVEYLVTDQCGNRLTHSFTVTIVCEEEEMMENDDQIFNDYPILSSLVDQDNCDGISVTVYQLGTYIYFHVVGPTNNTLYNISGVQYCQYSSNNNCAEAYGLSTVVTSWTCGDDCVCTEEYDPVCGEDGNTYDNACKAACEGVAVVSVGPCDNGGGNDDIFDNYPILSSLVDQNNCDDVIVTVYQLGPYIYFHVETPNQNTLYNIQGVQYCQYSSSNNCAQAYGLTDVIDTWMCEDDCICPTVYDPVCGEDGNTYGNACEAACEGVTVVSVGPCNNGGGSDQIFEDYPVLNTLVDINNCNGITVTVYQLGPYMYFHVERPNNNILYNSQGVQYCQYSSNSNCAEAYGLTEVVDTWACTEPNFEEGIELEKRNNFEDIKVYPNPFTEYITIELNEISEQTLISIIDVRGNLIRKISNDGLTNSSTHKLNTNTLLSGIYFIEIVNSKDKVIKKVIKL